MKRLIILLLIMSSAAYAFEEEIYYLDNGMQVVLIENHAAPVIASSIVIHNGLRDESYNIIGASHFLEHLLFNGTKTRTQEQLYEEMDYLGAYNNAHTGENFTNFVILAGKDEFAQALEIQADMIFNSVLPASKFEKEKGIVTEEIGQSYDRASYTADIHFASRFFRGTPYAFQVLGTKQSIRNMNRGAVREYYESHYIPNNMTAIITGDFERKEIKPVIAKYLGDPAPGKFPERTYYYPEWPDSPGIQKTYYHFEDSKNVLLRVGVPAPARMIPDYYTAEVSQYFLQKQVEEVFTGGENPLAMSASLEYFSDRDFGAFILRAQLSGDAEVEKAVQSFRQIFKDFSLKSVSAEEIANFIISEKSQSLFYSERPHFWAMMKAYLLGFHKYEFVRDYYDNLAEVNPSDLRNMSAAIYETGSFLPVAVIPYPEPAEEALTEAGEDFYQETLDNGLKLIIAPGSGSGVFAAHFLLKNRAFHEPDGKAGITNFLHNLLLKGTASKSESKLKQAMDKLGMKLEVTDSPWIPFDDYRSTPEFSYIRLEVPAENWKAAYELIAEIILDPVFSPAATEPVRGMLIGAATRSTASASAMSRSMFKQKLLGDHILARDFKGDMRTLSAIQAEDLREYHREYFTAGNLILTVTGDAPAAEIADETRKLFGMMPGGKLSSPQTVKPTPEYGEFREALGKRQSYIRIGYMIDNIPAEDRAALTVANSILSENMSFELREVQGLAYSMGSSLSVAGDWGYLMISMGTGPQNIEKAVEGIKKQLAVFANAEFSEQEVTKAKNSFIGRRNMRLLTSANRAYYMGIHTMAGENPDEEFRRLEEIGSVTPEDVNRCLQKYFQPEEFLTVIVE